MVYQRLFFKGTNHLKNEFHRIKFLNFQINQFSNSEIVSNLLQKLIFATVLTHH